MRMMYSRIAVTSSRSDAHAILCIYGLELEAELTPAEDALGVLEGHFAVDVIGCLQQLITHRRPPPRLDNRPED